MSEIRVSSLQKILKDESGQMLPLVAFMLIVLMGMAGLVIDVGRAYVGYRQLQASTDAAALAATQYMPDDTTATAKAIAYGGGTGGLNAVTSLKNVAMVSNYPKYTCLTSLGLACITGAGAPTGGANAVVVKQSGTVNLTFGALVGFKTFTVTTTATAAMRGAVAPPYNVAIVIDTTASMQDTDTDKSCNNTRISCAISGVQILLQNMNPCISSLSACGAAVSGNVSNPVDKVGIFTYPNITTGTVVDDTNCGSSNPTAVAYTFPSATATTYTPATTPSTTPTYQVVSYSSDYKSNDATSTLNPASNLSAALGAGPSTTTTTTGKNGKKTTTTTPCSGMAAPGGEGTFFAGAIYAAQASLLAAQVVNPKAQNVMIILSDGDACAGSIAACGNGNTTAMAGASATSGVYPSMKDQCQQAVTAAAAAKTNGTKVYTVAYGAASAGCKSDSPAITPCQTMQRMAYDASTFYSDSTASANSGACISAAVPVAGLAAIFTKISDDLTLARLIPDNTP